jgi:hypothetical protein
LGNKSLSIDLGGKASIDNFYLSPSNPGERVDYVAIADVYCIRAGSSVTISIVGTDGYTASDTKDFPSGVLNQRCTLPVPGAEAGVRDVCTITVNNPDGTNVTKTASLVFGN